MKEDDIQEIEQFLEPFYEKGSFGAGEVLDFSAFLSLF